MKLVLASASPRRRELLARAGVSFEVAPAEVDETPRPGEAPRALAARLAHAKAEAARRPDAFVLGADTIVVLGERVLGKPEDAAEAAAMLRELSGRTHVVLTATCLLAPAGAAIERTCATEVDVVPLGERDIAAYVASGEWRGKAGGYAAQGIASAFIGAVRGSYTNVVGLPLAEVLADLARAGAPGADLARGAAP
ncbi:MAG TPA: Maf family protein [Haliangiales bacterium]|nr:Maf family protein [Haliangiales bacterium]